MAKLHTFTADERLKSRKRIDELFEKGQRFNAGPFRIFYLMQAGTKPSLKCGAGASSKNFKRAVDRNRIKRLIRECWRVEKYKLKGQPYEIDLFIIYTGKTIPAFRETAGWIDKVVTKLQQLTNS